MNKGIVHVILGVLLAISVSLNVYLGYTVNSQKKVNTVKVIGVIDGDTIVLENKTRLRLRQLDAPETELCGGAQAKELLSSYVQDKLVRIENKYLTKRGVLWRFYQLTIVP